MYMPPRMRGGDAFAGEGAAGPGGQARARGGMCEQSAVIRLLMHSIGLFIQHWRFS
jgi:hypothetical protein